MTPAPSVARPLLNSLLFLPSRAIADTPAAAGLPFRELAIETEDGEKLHGWWIEPSSPSAGHVLLCHGNGGNIGDRVLQARLLAEAGLGGLLFDYRGYGRSSGRPTEAGTYRDARAALGALLEETGGAASEIIYLGESLGGAVALELALEEPPRGLILQSAFTSVREMARLHYPFIPRGIVPDAYPSLSLIPGLRAPLLVLHGERDEVVPAAHGEALFAAAPDPKRLHVFPGLGHNDLIALAGSAYSELLRSWLGDLDRGDGAR